MSCASSSWLAKAAPAAALFRGRDKGALREIESERPPLPRIIRRGSATLIELAPSILCANLISVHQEACIHLNRTLHLIATHGCEPAVVINPATPVHMLDEVLDIVHHVLVMSVNPGFGAQKFIPGALRKIESLAQIRERRGLSFRIEVDGGIDLTTVGDVVRAGADLLVAGNAVFAHGDVRDNARKLLQAARGATAMRA